MTNENGNNSTLTKNHIKKFILRVDLIKTDQLDISKFIKGMEGYFDRIEKRQIKRFTVNFTKSSSEIINQEAFDYVLILDSNSTSLTISESNKISRIYGKRLATILKYMHSDKSQSQIIGVETYNNDTHKIRLQYGIPNKYFPENLKVYDLIMDIDSFIDSKCSVQEWLGVIKELNHAAFKLFKKEINPKYYEELK